METTSINADYITVTKGMSGWFAVQLWWNEEDPELGGFWEPYDVGFGRYATREEAVKEGQAWAADEGLEFRE